MRTLIPCLLLAAVACGHPHRQHPRAVQPAAGEPAPAGVPPQPPSMPPAPAQEPAPKPSAPPPTLPDNPNGGPVSILVMPLHAEANIKSSAHALDEMILAAITHYKRYQVLGPEDLNALLGVQKMKDAMWCDDVSCAAELGGALGAQYLVSGELSSLGEEVVLSLRLLDTKAAKILARGAARGGTNADDLTTLMRDAVSETFNIPVANVAHAHSANTPPPEPRSEMGLTYQAVANELGKRAANKDYMHIMIDLDTFSTQSITAPPGSDAQEALVYWRGFACYNLQRPKCVEKFAAEYLRRWPDGVYAGTMKGYLDQAGALEQQKNLREQQLTQELNQIEARHRAGQLSDDQALELSAGAAMNSAAFSRAANFYEQLMERNSSNDARWFAYAEQCAVAHEVGQAYGKARAVLAAAQLRNSAMFRNRGLGLILGRLGD